jgi:hypothetical protein
VKFELDTWPSAPVAVICMTYVPAATEAATWIVTRSVTPETLSVSFFDANFTVMPDDKPAADNLTVWGAPLTFAVEVSEDAPPLATVPLFGLRDSATLATLFSVTVPVAVGVIVVEAQVEQAMVIDPVLELHEEKTYPATGLAAMGSDALALNHPVFGDLADPDGL